ncbi:MAG TPA: PAC2 family protein [Candidatus Eisenbacteria bacterium]|nr:PAC2 family protein [Candidatus Eisenbacteria bacterium]
MEFIDLTIPDINKPILVAAMQDMGDIGSVAIHFINRNLNTTPFRYVSACYPNYVIDRGGYIDFQPEIWQYRYSRDVIVFGGGTGQPQTNEELYKLCRDVIDIAKKYSVQLIYTLGAFHTRRNLEKKPKTFVTTTSQTLTERIRNLGIETTPPSSLITGFNGLILGFAKLNDIQGIGLYAEINDPQIPQYRSAKSVLQLLEKLTYHKFKDLGDLDAMGEAVDDEIERLKKSDNM